MMFQNDFDDVEKYPDFRRKVIFSVSDHIEKYGVGLFDTSELLFEKDVILHAYLYEIATNLNREEVAVFIAGATLLANFQPGVGRKRYSAAEVKKVLSMPPFERGEVSQSDRENMSKHLKLIEFFRKSSEERQNIYRQTQNALHLNSAVQHPVEKMRRAAWRIIRPCLHSILFGVVLVVALPLLFLSAERRERILTSPTRWINRLGEKPKYDWGHIPLNLR